MINFEFYTISYGWFIQNSIFFPNTINCMYKKNNKKKKSKDIDFIILLINWVNK